MRVHDANDLIEFYRRSTSFAISLTSIFTTFIGRDLRIKVRFVSLTASKSHKLADGERKTYANGKKVFLNCLFQVFFSGIHSACLVTQPAGEYRYGLLKVFASVTHWSVAHQQKQRQDERLPLLMFKNSRRKHRESTLLSLKMAQNSFFLFIINFGARCYSKQSHQWLS